MDIIYEFWFKAVAKVKEIMAHILQHYAAICGLKKLITTRNFLQFS